MRIDRLLFFLRLARTRSAAQRLIANGHMRLNGVRTIHQDRPVSIGDVLTLPLGSGVLVAEILALPSRRGPATETQSCYRALDAGQPMAIAGENPWQDLGSPEAEGNTQQ